MIGPLTVYPKISFNLIIISKFLLIFFIFDVLIKLLMIRIQSFSELIIKDYKLFVFL